MALAAKSDVPSSSGSCLQLHAWTSRSTSLVVTTVQYSPCRLASDIACTSSAVRHRPRQSRLPKVKTASSTSSTSNPRFAGHAHRGLHGVVGDHSRYHEAHQTRGA